MLLSSRVVLRLQPALPIRRLYSSAQDFHTIGAQSLYQPHNPVNFNDSGKLTIFDSTTKEKTKIPYEIKETTFKNGMAFLGFAILGYLPAPEMFAELFSLTSNICMIGFPLNWLRMTSGYYSASLNKIELHRDGKTVTFHSRYGSLTANIKDIAKQRHEKTLVETYEEGYLFPIKIGKDVFYLHGHSHEAIKNGELFRAIINGQQIKF